ncbi:hypothetical protein DCO60_10030 [Helicobacter saguini]
MSRFEKRLFYVWSGIFAFIVGLFFILSFVSRDRIYEANLEYKDSKILESNVANSLANGSHVSPPPLRMGVGGWVIESKNDFIEYNVKIKFKNQFFRAQKDLSDIEIMDFKFVDSNVDSNIESMEVTNVTSKQHSIESSNNNGGGG